MFKPNLTIEGKKNNPEKEETESAALPQSGPGPRIKMEIEVLEDGNRVSSTARRH